MLFLPFQWLSWKERQVWNDQNNLLPSTGLTITETHLKCHVPPAREKLSLFLGKLAMSLSGELPKFPMSRMPFMGIIQMLWLLWGIEARVRETDTVFKEATLIFLQVPLDLSLLCSKISAEEFQSLQVLYINEFIFSFYRQTRGRTIIIMDKTD